MKVSVIIPVYNVEKYIEKTIESLEHQTLKDIEVLFINDGSTDNTLDVINRRLKNSPMNYKLICKDNEGVSATRNRGIDEALGKYIYFLDGDDYIDSTTLEKIYEECEKKELQVCFCGYTHIKEEDGSVMRRVHKYIDEPINGLQAAAKMLNNDFWISAINGFYLTRFLKDNKIKFPEDIVFGEDTVFVVKALMNAHKVGCVKEPLVYYLRRTTSVTQSGYSKYFNLHTSNLKILEYNRETFKDYGVEQALLQYKIPQSLIRIFIVLTKGNYDKRELMTFMKREDIKNFLKGFKINGKKENIKFKLVSIAPLEVVSRILTLKNRGRN